MDPLIIHHVIRHRLSRIQTNNFQDKSGCSINGFRSFLFEQGIVQNLEEMSYFIEKSIWLQDYRGYPIQLKVYYIKNFPLSDEILRMKYINFYFTDQLKPIHKLVYPEPHFVEEERNLIENHFSYLGYDYKTDDIEEWKCFEMDNEGHLVSMKSGFRKCQLSEESIEHLSNFPHLTKLSICFNKNTNAANFSLLSNLKSLSLIIEAGYPNPEVLQDLGLFSNLLFLRITSIKSYSFVKKKP